MSDANVHAPSLAAPRARHDWRQVLAQASLPPELASRVERTVRSARLWRSERADVARELVTHFVDGLAAGTPADVLAREFGDPAAAARLITRARRRLRPAWYQAMVWTQRAMAVTILLTACGYGYLAARFYLAKPHLTHNYAAEYTKAATAAPVDERAWPLMLQAIEAFGPLPDWMSTDDFPRRPTEPNWSLAVEYTRDHAAALEMVRQAAARPTLGAPYRGASDPELIRAMQARAKFQWAEEPEDSNPLLIGVLLPQLGEMRRFGRLLAFDAREALFAGDHDRFIADVDAILDLSRHAWSEPFLISDQVGLSLLWIACEVINEAASADALSLPRIRHLAHRLAVSPASHLEFDFADDAAAYDDFAQRFFSDDGRGDGHTIYASMPALHRSWGTPDPSSKLLVRAALPAMTISHVSRAEFRRLTTEAIAAAERDQKLPLWKRHERTCDVSRERLDDAMGDVFPPVRSLMGEGGIGGQIIQRDQVAMMREATLTVLALQAHRAVHARYPKDLTALVPSTLPGVPVDAADGQPLRFRLTEGGPLLYSVGCDGDDDDGRPPARGVRFAQQFGPAKARPENNHPPTDPGVLADIDGDWVFFPPPAP